MTAMSDVQNEIACKALDLLLLLLARESGGDSNATEKRDGTGVVDDNHDDSKRPARQALVADVEDGMLSEMLAHVAFSRADAFSHAPVACRERAMRAVGALVDGHPTNQYNLGEVCRGLARERGQIVQGKSVALQKGWEWLTGGVARTEHKDIATL